MSLEAIKVGQIVTVSYAGREYQAAVLKVTKKRYLARFTTGTGSKSRWFYRQYERDAAWEEFMARVRKGLP